MEEFKNYQPPHWTEWFMRMVYLVASKSKDPRTKIGAVVVNSQNRLLSIGYNGMPIGVNDDVSERRERPLKYEYFVHGEANCCYSAANLGISLNNSILYTQGIPCTKCTQAIIQSGISKIVVHKQWMDWEQETKLAGTTSIYRENGISREMLDETGIGIQILDVKLDVVGYLDGKTKSL